MWSQLVQLIEQQSHQGPRGGDASAPALVALYGAFVVCRTAFERLDEDSAEEPAETDVVDAVLAIDVLLATLHNVQPTLELLEPELATELARYVRADRRPPDAGAPKDALRERVRTLRRLLALETTQSVLERAAVSDFTGAHRRLAELIRSSCTMDELFAG